MMKRIGPWQVRTLALTTLIAGPLIGCSEDGAGPGDRIVEGVNLDALFAEPTASELAAVRTEWSTRDVSVQGFRQEAESVVLVGESEATLRIVSHTVGGARHYGAIVIPNGAPAGTLPVLVYAHGGDQGVGIEELLLLAGFLPEVSRGFVHVVPSFRGESLSFQGLTFESDGSPSPWDRDVDDSLALLNAALLHTEQVDPARIGVLGFSRGAAVGMLMAIRDPGVDVVVEFFGPTDFFGSFVQDITEEALRGTLRDLPGLAYLNGTFIQPLKNGLLQIGDVRRELVRRSPVLFVDRLPQLQVHHGTADVVVDVSQAESLIHAMEAAQRETPGFEWYLYQGGGHNPLSLPGSTNRAAAFLSRLLPAPPTPPR